MSRYHIGVMVLIFGCLSCDRQSAESTNWDTQEVLNLTLDNAIGSDTIYRFLKLPPRISKLDFSQARGDTSEYSDVVRFRDSLKSVLDTATLHVVVGATYKLLSDRDKLDVRLAFGKIKKNAEIDESFTAPLSNLTEDYLLNRDSFLPQLSTKHNYRLFPYYSVFQNTNSFDQLREIGSISFSCVAYNESKNRACVYTNFNCGTLCGYGAVHFLKKENRQWIYVAGYNTWVS